MALAAALRGEQAAEGLTELEELGFLVLAQWAENAQLLAEAYTAK